MILPIVRYGHPALRQKGAEVRAVSDAIRRLARDMLETMYPARGLGLAAQQVARPLQLTVIDVRGTDRPSQLFLGVREAPVESLMPMILLNPKILRQEGSQTGPEGCLSFPGISADIHRAATVHVAADTLEGRPLQFTATGLLSRAIQHELDHLNGILFIDRMEPDIRKQLEPELRRLEKQTLAELKKKKPV